METTPRPPMRPSPWFACRRSPRTAASRRGARGITTAMNPLFLADYNRLHRLYVAVMWVLVLVLATVVLCLATSSSPSAAHGRGAHTAPVHRYTVTGPTR